MHGRRALTTEAHTPQGQVGGRQAGWGAEWHRGSVSQPTVTSSPEGHRGAARGRDVWPGSPTHTFRSESPTVLVNSTITRPGLSTGLHQYFAKWKYLR